MKTHKNHLISSKKTIINFLFTSLIAAFILCLSFTLSAQNCKICGTYKKNKHSPNKELTIQENLFKFKFFGHNTKTTMGVWELNGDTLILDSYMHLSDYFTIRKSQSKFYKDSVVLKIIYTDTEPVITITRFNNDTTQYVTNPKTNLIKAPIDTVKSIDVYIPGFDLLYSFKLKEITNNFFLITIKKPKKYSLDYFFENEKWIYKQNKLFNTYEKPDSGYYLEKVNE
jgi:hypothetical protein